MSTKVRVNNTPDGEVTVTSGGGAESKKFTVKDGVIAAKDAAEVALILRSIPGAVAEDGTRAGRGGGRRRTETADAGSGA